MESLHLSYEEVTERIPYRNLMVMAKDKQHIVNGELVKEVTEEEFFKERERKVVE